MTTVTFNGVPHPLPERLSITALLMELGLHGKRVAVEHNGVVVPKGRHDAVVVGEGDRLEVIVAVGGG